MVVRTQDPPVHTVTSNRENTTIRFLPSQLFNATSERAPQDRNAHQRGAALLFQALFHSVLSINGRQCSFFFFFLRCIHSKVKRGWKHIALDFFSPSFDNKAQLLGFEECNYHDWMTPCDICSWQSCFLRGKEARKGMKKEGRGKDYIKRIKTTIWYGEGAHEFSGETRWTPCFPVTSLFTVVLRDT